jgi:2-haloacid dehalogenase
MSQFDLIAFDAYGTLFDVNSAAGPHDVIQTMRQRQLQYSWLITLMGEYRDFRELTRAAALFALNTHKSAFDLEAIMGGQLTIPLFADVLKAVSLLSPRLRLAILSNGHPDSLAALLQHAGLADKFDPVVSVHEVQAYKPAPAAYGLLLDRAAVPLERLLFVSSNSWDVAGASAYGLRTAWLNRARAIAEPLDGKPEFVVTDLVDLAHAVA